MEHSLLHGLELNALFLTCGGPLLVLLFLRPAQAWGNLQSPLAVALRDSAARFVFYGALAAALATLADLVVETAELQGETLFGSWKLGLLGRFAFHSAIGRLSLMRAGLLLACVALAKHRFAGRWPVVGVLSLGTLILTSFVSHAAAQPTARALAIGTQAVHLLAGAIWMGVLMHLLAGRRAIESGADPESIQEIARVVQRFSPCALAVVVLLVVSGVMGLWRSLSSPSSLLSSPYGLTFLIKLALLAPALYAALMNATIIRPALWRAVESGQSGPSAAAVLGKFGRLLELEVTAGVLVVIAAGVLGSVSPPAQAGDQQLSAREMRALLTPHWPRSSFVSPASVYGAAQRTVNDLRYSEFMHNWSGIAVIGLGLCWLACTGTARANQVLGRAWPCLLAAFGVFIGVASDPELLLGVSPWQIFHDPEVFEHKLAAGLLLLLALLAWRDRPKTEDHRPLGYALPVLMICGSILLLGHAHSTLNSPEALTTTINVQHAIFGAFGLMAGTVRWLSLRGLFPKEPAARIWPLFVIGLGVFMAFFYKELMQPLLNQ